MTSNSMSRCKGLAEVAVREQPVPGAVLVYLAAFNLENTLTQWSAVLTRRSGSDTSGKHEIRMKCREVWPSVLHSGTLWQTATERLIKIPFYCESPLKPAERKRIQKTSERQSEPLGSELRGLCSSELLCNRSARRRRRRQDEEFEAVRSRFTGHMILETAALSLQVKLWGCWGYKQRFNLQKKELETFKILLPP